MRFTLVSAWVQSDTDALASLMHCDAGTLGHRAFPQMNFAPPDDGTARSIRTHAVYG